MAQPTMADWIDSLSPHAVTVLQATPIDQITAKFTNNFKQRYPDAELDDLSPFEQFTSCVTSDDGEKISLLPSNQWSVVPL